MSFGISGRNEPDLAMLLKIADVLHSTPNGLLGLEDGAQVKGPEISSLTV